MKKPRIKYKFRPFGLYEQIQNTQNSLTSLFPPTKRNENWSGKRVKLPPAPAVQEDEFTEELGI